MAVDSGAPGDPVPASTKDSCTMSDGWGDHPAGMARGNATLVSVYAPGPHAGSVSGKENVNAHINAGEDTVTADAFMRRERPCVLSITAAAGNPVAVGDIVCEGLPDGVPDDVDVQLRVAAPEGVCDGDDDAEGVELTVPDSEALLEGLEVAVWLPVRVLLGERVAAPDFVTVDVPVRVWDGVRVADCEAVRVTDCVCVELMLCVCDGDMLSDCVCDVVGAHVRA